MAIRQYIGARYVPQFANPIDWDKSKTYEPLTIVYAGGNSYTSRQSVPAGIEISNTDYWALTGNYNAQIEQYRAEVAAYDARIAALEADGSVTAGKIADDAVTGDKIADNAVGSAQIAADAVTGDKIANNAVGTSQIANDAVTGDKIANNAVGAQNVSSGIVNFDKLLVIGDSWSDPIFESGVSGTWVQKVAQMLGFNDYQNISESGAGFAHKNAHSRNFNDILNYNLENISDKDRITHIVVYGGLNDLNNSEEYSDIGAGIASLLANVNSNFPNAQTHIVGINANYNIVPTINSAGVILLLAENSVKYDAIFHNSDSWYATNADFLGSNNHPTTAGNGIIAEYMKKALLNAPCGINGWIRFTVTGSNPNQFFFPIVDNKIKFTMLSLGNGIANGTEGSFISSIDISKMPSILIPLITGSSNDTAWMQISQTSGTGKLTFKTPENANIFIPSMDANIFY